MSVSESEAYDAGMSLPLDARRRLALRLLDSMGPDPALNYVAESWLRTEAAAAYDALQADPARATPVENVRARFGAKWAARS